MNETRPTPETDAIFSRVESFLEEMGFKPSRIGITGDGSKLFQFLHGDVQACVDVYPDGDIVILAKRSDGSDGDDSFELNSEKDLAHIAKILVTYGVPWGVPEFHKDSAFEQMRARLERERDEAREASYYLAEYLEHALKQWNSWADEGCKTLDSDTDPEATLYRASCKVLASYRPDVKPPTREGGE